MPHDILFSLLQLLDQIQNTKKMKTRESKETKFEKKGKRNRVSCFKQRKSRYMVEVKWNVVFGILLICYV